MGQVLLGKTIKVSYHPKQHILINYPCTSKDRNCASRQLTFVLDTFYMSNFIVFPTCRSYVLQKVEG